MNDSHSEDLYPHEIIDVKEEWVRQDGREVGGMEQKVNYANLAARPRRKLKSEPKKDDESPFAQLCAWLAEHQIGLSVNLLLLLALTHLCFPRARQHTRKFFELSYYNPISGEYTSGWDDACMVFYWIVLFTGLRASVMDYMLTPFAQWAGIDKKKDLTRFAEQGWLLIYCSVFWSLGMYIMYHSEYWLNIKAVWYDWPNREIGGLLKWYILVQFGFWIQQIMVINIEKRRKDHWQMFTHHIVTCILLFTSYGYHQTKVANLILCLMDVVDILLPLAKCLKYLGFSTICDVIFGLFMVTWFLSRHVLFNMVCYSVWHDIPIEINYGCYRGKKGSLTGPFEPPDKFGHLIDPFRNPEGVVCFNHKIKWGFLSNLLFLQAITLMWFWMICQVAAKVLAGGKADDSRSDNEDEEDEENDASEEAGQAIFEKLEPVQVTPLEEEVGVEAINLNGRNTGTRRYKKSTSSSTGVTLAVHGDRKELLGRIGCDKGV